MSWLQLLKQMLTAHLSCLFTQLDPLKELDSASAPQFQAGSQRSRKRSWNGHLLFPPFIIAFSALYGVFWLEYEARGEIQLDELHRSEYIFLHQITPRSIWAQVRSFQFCQVFNVVICAAFGLHFQLSPRSLMLYDGTNIVVDSKGELSKQNEEKQG